MTPDSVHVLLINMPRSLGCYHADSACAFTIMQTTHTCMWVGVWYNYVSMAFYTPTWCVVNVSMEI